MYLSRTQRSVVHSERKVERAQGIAADGVDLRVEECTQRIVHRERVGVAVGEIHARCKHGHSQLATVLYRLRHQFVVHLLVVGCVDGKLQSHVLQRLGYHDTTLECNAAAGSAVIGHGCLVLFCGGDVESRIHRVAREFGIAAVLDGKCLERNYGQRVFHLTRTYSIASVQTQSVAGSILHTQVSSTNEVNIVGVVGIECAQHMRTVVDVDREVHVESVDWRTCHGNGIRVAEVDKLHESIELIVGGEWRVAQYICDVARTQHIESSTHTQRIERSLSQSEEVDPRLAISLRACRLLRVDEQIVVGTHSYVERHVCHVGKVDISAQRKRIAVAGKELEVLERKAAVGDGERVVAHTHLDAIGFACHIG